LSKQERVERKLLNPPSEMQYETIHKYLLAKGLIHTNPGASGSHSVYSWTEKPNSFLVIPRKGNVICRTYLIRIRNFLGL